MNSLGYSTKEELAQGFFMQTLALLKEQFTQKWRGLIYANSPLVLTHAEFHAIINPEALRNVHSGKGIIKIASINLQTACRSEASD